MFGEYFIDQCLTACVSLDSQEKQIRDTLESIHFILKWIKKETPKDSFPIEFKDKYDLATYVAKYRSDHRDYNFETMLHGMVSGKFSDFIPVLEAKRREINEDERKDLNKTIYQKRKLCEMTIGKRNMMDKLRDLETGLFDDDNDAIQIWEELVTGLHNQVMDVKKMESIEDVSFLDLYNDDYGPVMNKLRHQSDFDSSVKTGFKFLKESLPAQGFEPTRFYLIGGTSGVGKSTILANFLVNAVKGSPEKPSNERNVFLYITAENLIDESLERVYCIMTGKPLAEVKRMYDIPGFTLKTALMKILETTGGNIILCYVQPKKTTIRDIESIIDKILTYGHNLKGVFIDYLDLIRTGFNLSDYRHELGEVAVGFKNMAVMYRLPFVTVTQLNRGGYNANEQPSLVQMSESMQKIDNSDFVLFLQNDKEPELGIPTASGIPKTCKNIKATVLKNRSGPVNKSCNLIMQERIGEQDIFNFRIEEKGKMHDPIHAFFEETEEKTEKGAGLVWGSF